jgi:hypothetical protein
MESLLICAHVDLLFSGINPALPVSAATLSRFIRAEPLLTVSREKARNALSLPGRLIHLTFFYRRR